ncbi:hypothetical protein HETIRDRAFT_476431 [Heterobasidion irregulare TC 32-1]|uniref:Uncharacterized protein n=1 Tax=Heterobasidion irregulare (strain TC 32-1) TaxID=747525 RepID=W4K4G6_HETIT|nr:uncharacterized protein HETIRDRAFT_476431 [Heterobasidion irregulare TC 32-1]ETW80728.1 hypothetical protein HETIRDRAFT_476431 [Heterobasidion irregulare TC 32-1]
MRLLPRRARAAFVMHRCFFTVSSRGAHGGRERLQLGRGPLLVSLFSLALSFARRTDRPTARTHAPRSPMHTTTTRSSHGAGRFNIPRTAVAAAVARVIRAAPRVRAVVEADVVEAAVPTADAAGARSVGCRQPSDAVLYVLEKVL